MQDIKIPMMPTGVNQLLGVTSLNGTPLPFLENGFPMPTEGRETDARRDMSRFMIKESSYNAVENVSDMMELIQSLQQVARGNLFSGSRQLGEQVLGNIMGVDSGLKMFLRQTGMLSSDEVPVEEDDAQAAPRPVMQRRSG